MSHREPWKLKKKVTTSYTAKCFIMMALQSRWPTQLSSTTEKSWAAWRVSLTKRKNTTRSFTAECSCFDSTILSPFVCRTRATITWEREIVSLGHLCSTMLKTKGVGKGRVFVPQSTLTTLLLVRIARNFTLVISTHMQMKTRCLKLHSRSSLKRWITIV